MRDVTLAWDSLAFSLLNPPVRRIQASRDRRADKRKHSHRALYLANENVDEAAQLRTRWPSIAPTPPGPAPSNPNAGAWRAVDRRAKGLRRARRMHGTHRGNVAALPASDDPSRDDAPVDAPWADTDALLERRCQSKTGLERVSARRATSRRLRRPARRAIVRRLFHSPPSLVP
ncbi:hypothetical protein L227DRAFT_188698 [Lentinus tigrinus ALCF2SS1-6]|uniref:Uncharacterized protein n=1 Tax=Lentinus tigrinus ALCF2SS1-6 TaxID=1328759 RepID=A0A5C2S4C3_9APHY|nr:hypothetical protein L227DRAFT_188698 [Lentinus tigrinus ALCF2SS1-6]